MLCGCSDDGVMMAHKYSSVPKSILLVPVSFGRLNETPQAHKWCLLAGRRSVVFMADGYVTATKQELAVRTIVAEHLKFSKQ